MKKIIVFDFNRTIYNPETGRLAPSARFVLQTLLQRGFTLYLISRAGQSKKQIIDKFGLRKYFDHILLVREKNKESFKRLVNLKLVIHESSFVIGDRVREEIAIGNILSLQTIWVRIGKFSDELPQKKIEQPKYIINALKDVLKIIR